MIENEWNSAGAWNSRKLLRPNSKPQQHDLQNDKLWLKVYIICKTWALVWSYSIRALYRSELYHRPEVLIQYLTLKKQCDSTFPALLIPNVPAPHMTMLNLTTCTCRWSTGCLSNIRSALCLMSDLLFVPVPGARFGSGVWGEISRTVLCFSQPLRASPITRRQLKIWNVGYILRTLLTTMRVLHWGKIQQFNRGLKIP